MEQNTTAFLNALFGLSRRTAVVIGGSGTLGLAICEALGRAGAQVVVVGMREAAGVEAVEKLSKYGVSAEAIVADATRREDLERIVAGLQAQGRSCDILVNAAGVNSPTPFLKITDDEWDRIMNINLSSVRLACQVFGQEMLDHHIAGSIINVASLSAITPLSRVFTYSASKAAVLNLTQNLAREWATSGIRVNALSPGFFPAEQNRKVLTPDRVQSIHQHTPMQRFGDPQELMGAVLLLAANKAGSFLTGANLVVDGGFTAMTI